MAFAPIPAIWLQNKSGNGINSCFPGGGKKKTKRGRFYPPKKGRHNLGMGPWRSNIQTPKLGFFTPKTPGRRTSISALREATSQPLNWVFLPQIQAPSSPKTLNFYPKSTLCSQILLKNPSFSPKILNFCPQIPNFCPQTPLPPP